MIHEEICTFEVCKFAKEKGFDVDCEAFYYGDGFLQFARFENWNGRYISRFSAPTQSLLQRWLREEKKIVVEVGYYSVEQKYYWRVFDTSKCDGFASFIPPSKSMSRYDTWEQALGYGLEYALKELK